MLKPTNQNPTTTEYGTVDGVNPEVVLVPFADMFVPILTETNKQLAALATVAAMLDNGHITPTVRQVESLRHVQQAYIHMQTQLNHIMMGLKTTGGLFLDVAGGMPK